MSRSVTFQAYKWEVDESEDTTIIYIYGLSQRNERVVVKVPDFKPYVYLELDSKFKWTPNQLELLKAYLREALHGNYPKQVRLVERRKNYYYREAKFLWMSFDNTRSIKALERTVRGRLLIHGIGNIKLQVHEQRANPVLKLFAMRKVKPAGWIVAKETTKQSLLEEHGGNFATADIQLVSSFKGIKATDIDSVVNPRVLSYDIECVSGDKSGNTFPNAKNKDDQIICISATVANIQDPEDKWRVYALVNEAGGRVCPSDLEDGSEVRHFKDEKSLILGWAEFVNEIDPDVITGYNTLTFDDKYLIDRAGKLLCWPKFSQLGRLIAQRSKTDERQWSSSAYGDQKFNFIDIQGRLHIDMLPVIFKDYGDLMSYNLDYVSEHFLGDHKVDLPAKEMMKAWYNGSEGEIANIVTYCNKDTFLPLKLMQKLNTWLGLTEMANVMTVQVFDLVTRGQQIRVFSQVYCLAYDLGVVCTEKWSDYKPDDEEKIFVGATVQNPDCGYWELVATYDFKSLYPTTIIAHNLCFSTFVPEDENPPLEDYHDLQWHDHSGCEHDTAIRKTKVTKKICKSHHYRFYKAHIKKGIIPMLLENVLEARSKTRKTQGELKRKLQEESDQMSKAEIKQTKMMINVLEKRQLGYKVSANSMYGGFGSDYSYQPFYPAAASTTAMGRKSIKDAIDFAKAYREDTQLVYGDTDSCMLKFRNIKSLEECFRVCEDLEEKINAIFPKPMYLELEKIYSKYFLLSKKRYVGYIVDKKGNIIVVDKKGVVIKRRDNCGYLRKVYTKLIDMVMDKRPRWEFYEYLKKVISDLLTGNVELEDLIITKSIKDSSSYKTTNLPHLAVSKKMQERGKYVTAGTRIRYIFVDTGNNKDPQYIKAEDPDYYLENKNIRIDYLYYFEKQLVNPIDEILEVKFKQPDILKNLLRLMKKSAIAEPKNYFEPKFKIE